MSVYKKIIIRTFHRLDDADTTEIFDDPTEGLGWIEHIEPAETGGSIWVYWVMPV